MKTTGILFSINILTWNETLNFNNCFYRFLLTETSQYNESYSGPFKPCSRRKKNSQNARKTNKNIIPRNEWRKSSNSHKFRVFMFNTSQSFRSDSRTSTSLMSSRRKKYHFDFFRFFGILVIVSLRPFILGILLIRKCTATN